MSAPRRSAALVGAAALLLTGCTSFADTVTDADPPAAAPPTSEPAPADCEERAEPDPDRPEIALDFRL
ncbi:MAG: peptidase M1, partial [Blastococcus sp.]|nr:peptidase M1 [Blastococcus sp.]